MITKQQAELENYFHSSIYKNADGSCQRWRRNGATHTWKTRPDEFRIPIKYGLRGFAAIDQANANNFHLASECTNKKQ